MTSSWLQRKRKGELLDLAHQVNLPDADGLLKDDLVEALHDHLEANETTYGKQSAFSDFYRRTGSPVKRERTSPSEALTVTKPRRRQTLKSADSEEPTPEKTLVTRTPRTVSRVASRISQVDLPASPAQLAEVADQSFQAAKSKATELWGKTRIEEAIDVIRENASSVVFMQWAIVIIEAAGLGYNTLKWRHAFDSPAMLQQNKTANKKAQVHLPDVSLVLTSGFLAPATLWSLTGWFLPALFSYFFNLTLRSNTRHKTSSKQYRIDPLTFNIARALLAYSAYALNDCKGVNETDGKSGWGPFNGNTVSTVCGNVPGEYYGLQIGSLVGVLVSLYDATLKK